MLVGEFAIVEKGEKEQDSWVCSSDNEHGTNVLKCLVFLCRRKCVIWALQFEDYFLSSGIKIMAFEFCESISEVRNESKFANLSILNRKRAPREHSWQQSNMIITRAILVHYIFYDISSPFPPVPSEHGFQLRVMDNCVCPGVYQCLAAWSYFEFSNFKCYFDMKQFELWCFL